MGEAGLSVVRGGLLAVSIKRRGMRHSRFPDTSAELIDAIYAELEIGGGDADRGWCGTWRRIRAPRVVARPTPAAVSKHDATKANQEQWTIHHVSGPSRCFFGG
jgi:hypothetical protein